MAVSSEVRSPGLLRTIFLSSSALLLVITVVASPKEAFDASIQGLDIWWKIVFPALLPFLMLSQMLTAFGFTHAIGVLLEPLMRRLFKLPGNTGFALAVGMCGGFPAAADAVSRLIQDKQITTRQAVITAAAAHFANPMMILLVVGAAFLHQPAAGYFLLIIHWTSGWIAAAAAIRLLPALRKEQSLSSDITSPNKIVRSQTQSQASKMENDPSSSILSSSNVRLASRMLHAAREAHNRDARSFGKLLGDTVSQAVQTLMLTGGYMIVFAVFIRLLSLYLTPGISTGFWPSILELHLGAYHLSNTLLAPAILMALLAALLGWGGVCSHLQVFSILKTALPKGQSMLYFVIVRLGHGLTAFCLTLLLWKPFSHYSTEVWAAWAADTAAPTAPLLLRPILHLPDTANTLHVIWSTFPAAVIGLAVLLGVMISLSGLTLWMSRLFSR